MWKSWGTQRLQFLIEMFGVQLGNNRNRNSLENETRQFNLRLQEVILRMSTRLARQLKYFCYSMDTGETGTV